MKMLLPLLLLFVGCAESRSLVDVVDYAARRTVDIRVVGIDEVMTLVLDKKGFRIEKSTRTVAVQGSGVFISPNNHVLTCDHLFDLKEIQSITVCDYTETCTAADLINKEERFDLALLQTFFDTPTLYATLDRRPLRVGQEVIAVGSPLGFPFTVTHGIISAVNRDGLGVPGMTQVDASINPGNSGGPLFSRQGYLIGINSRIVSPVRAPIWTGLGFSVSPTAIRVFLNRFNGVQEAL